MAVSGRVCQFIFPTLSVHFVGPGRQTETDRGHCLCWRCAGWITSGNSCQIHQARPSQAQPGHQSEGQEGMPREGTRRIWWVATLRPYVGSRHPGSQHPGHAAHLLCFPQCRFHAQRCGACWTNSGSGRRLCVGVICRRCVSAWSATSPDRGCRPHEVGLLPGPLSGSCSVGFGCMAIQRLYLFSLGGWQGRLGPQPLSYAAYRNVQS